MTCPICSKKPASEYRPFCSKHCSDVDLVRWLNESYAIPVTDELPDEADLASDQDQTALH